MVIIHIIQDGSHYMTRLFNSSAVEDILVYIRSAPLGSEIILCDENNYPLEDTE